MRVRTLGLDCQGLFCLIILVHCTSRDSWKFWNFDLLTCSDPKLISPVLAQAVCMSLALAMVRRHKSLVNIANWSILLNMALMLGDVQKIQKMNWSWVVSRSQTWAVAKHKSSNLTRRPATLILETTFTTTYCSGLVHWEITCYSMLFTHLLVQLEHGEEPTAHFAVRSCDPSCFWLSGLAWTVKWWCFWVKRLAHTVPIQCVVQIPSP